MAVVLGVGGNGVGDGCTSGVEVGVGVAVGSGSSSSSLGGSVGGAVGLAAGSVALGVAVEAGGRVAVGGVLVGEGSTHSLTRTLSVAELTPFAVALLVIMVVGATPVRTRT